MLYAGLDLSRQRLDVHILREDGTTAYATAVAPDGDALRSLARRVAGEGQAVRASVESMTGARFVHDQLEWAGWEVLIADAQRVRGLAPLAAKTDKIDARVLAELTRRALVPPDLAADARRPGGARTGSLSAPPGPSPDRAQEPHPRDLDDVRPSLPDDGPVRRGRPRAA